MKPKQIIIMFLSVAFLFGCAGAGSYQRTKNLKIGMTKQEVLETVGVPDSISASRISDTGNIEYLKYTIIKGLFSTDDYYIKLVDGKVESYGERGEFNLPH
jgi:hypothetical protein